MQRVKVRLSFRGSDLQQIERKLSTSVINNTNQSIG